MAEYSRPDDEQDKINRALYEAGRKLKRGDITWQEFVRLNDRVVPGLGDMLEGQDERDEYGHKRRER